MKNRKRAAASPIVVLIILVIVVFFIFDRVVDNEPNRNADNSAIDDYKENTWMDEGFFASDSDEEGSEQSSLFLSPDASTINGPFAVDYVVDGDTIYIINAEGDREKVRFIGIDTPESVHQDESRNVEEGKVASDYTKELLEDAGQVYLVYDVEKTDDYGRTLAYVYIATDDSYTMMQDLLLYSGMARTMTIQPNSTNAAHFAAVQRDAQAAGRGFWGDYSSLFVEG